MESLIKRDNIIPNIHYAGIILSLVTVLIGYLYVGTAHIVICYLLLPVAIFLIALESERFGILRYPETKLLPALFAVVLLSTLTNLGYADAKENVSQYASLVVTATLCGTFAYVFPKEERSMRFEILCWLYSVPVAICAIPGLWIGIRGLRQSDGFMLGYIGFDERLYLILNPNVLGICCALAISLILYLLMKQGSIFRKLILSVLALLSFALLVLTDCRTALYAVLPSVFLFAVLAVCQRTKPDKKLYRVLIGVGTGASMCLLIVVLNKPLQSLLMRAEPVTAETLAEVGITDADYDPRAYEGTIDERLTLWTHALTTFIRDPYHWAFGATPAGALGRYNDPAMQKDHFHNGYLGILLSYGVVGFLIFVIFLVVLAVKSCILLFSSKEVPAEERFLPAILTVALASNLMEEMFFTRSFLSETSIFLCVVSGMIFCHSREWKKKKPAEEGNPMKSQSL